MNMSDKSDTNAQEHTKGLDKGMYVAFQGQTDFPLQEKVEKICHAVLFLIGRGSERPAVCVVLEDNALACVSAAAHFCIRREGKEELLASMLEIASLVRLGVTAGAISEGSAQVVVGEIVKTAERITRNALPSVSADDLHIDERPGERAPLAAFLKEPFMQRLPAPLHIKDTSRTLSRKRTQTRPIQRKAGGLSDREGHILAVVKEKGTVGIKVISQVVKGCSEKTLQRSLLALVGRGTLIKEGERRWSVYRLA